VSCSNCNKGIGQFKENPEFLLAAVTYLQEFGYVVIDD
jgi:hypothetical protein